MASTLAQLRTLVREHIDEASAVRWTDATINSWINISVGLVQNFIVSTGNNALETTATVTVTNGVADLTAQNPIQIVSLALNDGASRPKIYYVRTQDQLIPATYTGSLTLGYIPYATALVNDSDTANYGPTGWSNTAADDLVVVYAAQRAVVKDNEVRQQLDALRFQDEQALRLLPSLPQYALMMSSDPEITRSQFDYIRSGVNSITLIQRLYYG